MLTLYTDCALACVRGYSLQTGRPPLAAHELDTHLSLALCESTQFPVPFPKIGGIDRREEIV